MYLIVSGIAGDCRCWHVENCVHKVGPAEANVRRRNVRGSQVFIERKQNDKGRLPGVQRTIRGA